MVVIAAIPGGSSELLRRALVIGPIAPAFTERRYVGLHAENRLDVVIPAIVVEGKQTAHLAVIGEGNRPGADFNRTLSHLLSRLGAVEERIFGMVMKMNEIRHMYVLANNPSLYLSDIDYIRLDDDVTGIIYQFAAYGIYAA